jgi:hypothetical protein
MIIRPKGYLTNRVVAVFSTTEQGREPGNAILLNGVFQNTNRENGVPGDSRASIPSPG